MLVALVGVGGVIYTQRRADARQDRVAAANRVFERQARVVDKRRELASEFVTAVWLLGAASRDAIPDGADYSDLNLDETADVTRTLSALRLVLDPAGREAAQGVFDALLAHVGTFTQRSWDAIGEAEDKLIAEINEEAHPVRPVPAVDGGHTAGTESPRGGARNR